MRHGYKAMVIVCTMLVLLSISTSYAWAAGLHFTKEEIAIWRTRKDNGPYKDEWTVILNRATSWRNNPDPRWEGNTSGGCWDPPNQITPDRSLDAGLRDAGFVYLITGDTSYRDAVRTQLLAQADVPGTDWTNTTIWCPAAGNASHYFNVTNLVRRWIYGYSYIRDSLSSADKTTLDTWFLNAGIHFDQIVHNVIKKRFANRLVDDYSSCTGGSSFCPGDNLGITHFGGPMTTIFHRGWDNTITAIAAAVAAAGVLVNDSTLMNNSKRYVKEWIKYATFPGGQVLDQHRWGNQTPQHAYLYTGVTLGSLITIADHLARAGDPELYEYQTSDGMFGSEGGPKSLLRILQHFAGMTNGTVIEYASTTATSDPDKIIRQNGPTMKRIEYVNLTPASIYYNDPAISQAYQTPLPSSWSGSGCDMLSGDWCTYPRIRFMFGQMEGKVFPYALTGSDTVPPSAPSGLKIVQ